MVREYCSYMMGSYCGALYAGVTNDLIPIPLNQRRIFVGAYPYKTG